MGTEIYDSEEYFLNRPEGMEQISWESGQLRYGDMCCAVGYALGLESFEEVQNILGFLREGKENYPLLGAKMQMDMLWMARKRTPIGILEIGGGRGEIQVGLQHVKFNSGYMIEPSESVFELVRMTRRQFGIMEGSCERRIRNVGLKNYHINIESGIDTVILCETVEHIRQQEFDDAFTDWIKPLLRQNKGLLIVVNWLTPFPLELDPPWHVRRCDDKFYDWLAEDGKIAYRNKSHLVVRYG